jgi:hypothetical protein
MAAKKKKKAKKASRPAKAKKAPAKKSPKKAKAKKAKKTVKAAAKKAPAKKAKKPAAKKKQAMGEGNYAASRKFDKDEATFIAKNKANIPSMGKEAEKALEGPEGAALRDAEAAGLARSRDTF